MIRPFNPLEYRDPERSGRSQRAKVLVIRGDNGRLRGRSSMC
jgi:hypothetical protein